MEKPRFSEATYLFLKINLVAMFFTIFFIKNISGYVFHPSTLEAKVGRSLSYRTG